MTSIMDINIAIFHVLGKKYLDSHIPGLVNKFESHCSGMRIETKKDQRNREKI